MAYLVAARWIAKDGEEENVLAAVRRVIEPSRAEPGCRFYQASRDPEDVRVFFFAEVYDDADAFAAHVASAHFQRHVLDDAVPRLAERERRHYETLD